MLKIDRYAYTNKLRCVHPAEKLAFALAMLIACLALSSRLASLLVVLFMAASAVLRAKIPALFYLKLLLVPASFLLAGVFTVALSFSKDASLFLAGVKLGGCVLGFTAAGLATALDLFLKSLGAVSCLYFLVLTTPAVEIFALLRKLRLPPLFVELMALVYRFIFVLLETAEKIYLSQSSRGGYATLKTAYFSLGQLAANLFAKSYRHSQLLFLTLSARCYTGELNVLDEPCRFSPRNLLLSILAGLTLLAAGYCAEKGAGPFAR